MAYLAALLHLLGLHRREDGAGDADALGARFLAHVRGSVAGAGVAGGDHDRDALGGHLDEVAVDDGHVSVLDVDLCEVALPAVRDRVDDRHLQRQGQVSEQVKEMQ